MVGRVQVVGGVGGSVGIVVVDIILTVGYF